MRILCGTILAAVMLAAGLGCERRGDAASFAEFDARARAGENLTVAYFGCSLMWSANASEPNETGFRGLMSRYLEKRYPKAHFRFVDATVGGTGAMLGVFRLERDVLSKKPDLVFLDFACNDGWDGKALATTCCYESIVRRLVDDGIPVMQMFFTFRFWAEKSLDPESETAVHKAGKGRLFFWRDVLLKDYGEGESMVHKWTIDPIPDGKGEFRIGAICTATIKPEATFAGDDGSDFDISAIDHAQGVK